MKCEMIVSCWEFDRKSLRGTNTPHSFTNQLTKPLECLNYIHNVYDTTIKTMRKHHASVIHVYCSMYLMYMYNYM